MIRGKQITPSRNIDGEMGNAQGMKFFHEFPGQLLDDL